MKLLWAFHSFTDIRLLHYSIFRPAGYSQVSSESKLCYFPYPKTKVQMNIKYALYLVLTLIGKMPMTCCLLKKKSEFRRSGISLCGLTLAHCLSYAFFVQSQGTIFIMKTKKLKCFMEYPPPSLMY